MTNDPMNVYAIIYRDKNGRETIGCYTENQGMAQMFANAGLVVVDHITKEAIKPEPRLNRPNFRLGVK